MEDEGAILIIGRRGGFEKVRREGKKRREVSYFMYPTYAPASVVLQDRANNRQRRRPHQ